MTHASDGTISADPLLVASAMLGVALTRCSFSDIHRISEHLCGHPVWTHELADASMQSRILAAGLAQFPDMPTTVPEGAWREVSAAVRNRYGDIVDVARGQLTRSEDPITSAARVMRGEQR